MSDKEFFSISGVAVAAHTPETKKIWQSWPDCKSDKGRKAILAYAQDLGFEYAETEIEEIGAVKEAFNFLLSQFPNVSGIKSFILRQAIINYS
jgi:hypothetical protein